MILLNSRATALGVVKTTVLLTADFLKVSLYWSPAPTQKGVVVSPGTNKRHPGS